MPQLFACPARHPPPPQSLYVDMRQVVQLHASVEEIGMRSARWTTISHGVRYTQLPDGTMGLEAAPKCVVALCGLGLPPCWHAAFWRKLFIVGRKDHRRALLPFQALASAPLLIPCLPTHPPVHRLPQDVPMRMLGVGMELPTSQDDPSSIDRCFAWGLHLGCLPSDTS